MKEREKMANFQMEKRRGKRKMKFRKEMQTWKGIHEWMDGWMGECMNE